MTHTQGFATNMITLTMRRTLVLATLLILAAVTAGCGGGGSKSSAGTVAAGVTTTASEGSPTIKATGGGSYCKQVADSFNSNLRGAGQSASTPDVLRRQYEESKQKSQAALNSAPGEIKPDLRILLEVGTKFGDELAKVNFDISKLPTDATKLYSTPQAQAAGAHLLAFLKDRCGIDLTGGDTTETTAP